jgi:hypothetical protein
MRISTAERNPTPISNKSGTSTIYHGDSCRTVANHVALSAQNKYKNVTYMPYSPYQKTDSYMNLVQ